MDDHSNAMRIQVEAGFRRIEKQNHEFNKRFRNVREWIRKNTCCDQNGLFIVCSALENSVTYFKYWENWRTEAESRALEWEKSVLIRRWREHGIHMFRFFEAERVVCCPLPWCWIVTMGARNHIRHFVQSLNSRIHFPVSTSISYTTNALTKIKFMQCIEWSMKRCVPVKYGLAMPNYFV